MPVEKRGVQFQHRGSRRDARIERFGKFPVSHLLGITPRRRQPDLALAQAALPVDGNALLQHDHGRCLVLEESLPLLGSPSTRRRIRAFLLSLVAGCGRMLSRPWRGQLPHLNLCPAVLRLQLDEPF